MDCFRRFNKQFTTTVSWNKFDNRFNLQNWKRRVPKNPGRCSIIAKNKRTQRAIYFHFLNSSSLKTEKKQLLTYPNSQASWFDWHYPGWQIVLEMFKCTAMVPVTQVTRLVDRSISEWKNQHVCHIVSIHVVYTASWEVDSFFCFLPYKSCQKLFLACTP